MKKKTLKTVNSLLAASLVALGFSACKTPRAAQPDAPANKPEPQQPDPKKPKKKDLNPDGRDYRLLYGVPPTPYREMPVRPEDLPDGKK